MATAILRAPDPALGRAEEHCLRVPRVEGHCQRPSAVSHVTASLHRDISDGGRAKGFPGGRPVLGHAALDRPLERLGQEPRGDAPAGEGALVQEPPLPPRPILKGLPFAPGVSLGFGGRDRRQTDRCQRDEEDTLANANTPPRTTPRSHHAVLLTGCRNPPSQDLSEWFS